ncbi:hypothetical protein [uncultured Psychroserpens sp.]|uniref:hypothetical protein n=1 Tax=uncultured Psychroserpens sp. TaxID=255436 RepID=UPI00260DDC65|nr:hypothetical protein [uncultured Psychroserpens sp.]
MFNKSIYNYLDTFEFKIYRKDGDNDCDKYRIDNPDISLYLDDNNKIESINCRDECLYKGRNLIGMTIEDFISHTGEKYYGEVDILDYEDDGIPQYVYEFDDIGLQVWCKNNIVVTIIASPEISDEE